jgi:hypothetical protein
VGKGLGLERSYVSGGLREASRQARWVFEVQATMQLQPPVLAFSTSRRRRAVFAER